jgi:hypothetical protein
VRRLQVLHPRCLLHAVLEARGRGWGRAEQARLLAADPSLRIVRAT